jgi:hypothetical protein|tara:strand:- start:33 stop:263 length:231 start_codon:yes stop_codon:yes gene_type:complete
MAVSQILLSALVTHYESERQESLAMLSLYLNNPVPVAEHSDILGEIKKWTCKLSQAEENLNTIQKNIAVPQEDSPD